MKGNESKKPHRGRYPGRCSLSVSPVEPPGHSRGPNPASTIEKGIKNFERTFVPKHFVNGKEGNMAKKRKSTRGKIVKKGAAIR